ncbi:MAG: Ig-like domain repeat protein [Acidobacteriaceae bacterium]
MFPSLSSTLSSTLARASALLALAAATGLSAQTTRNVGPGQTYTTIQSGIDAANPGDTVLVAPGTYYENIDFKGKAITVTTSGGSAVTTIDGSGLGPAVSFVNQESRTAVLSNFTITHGGTLSNPGSTVYAGPGILIADSAPTILNNIVTKNYCQNIQLSFAAPLLQNNVVSFSLNPAQCSVGSTGGIASDGMYTSPGNGPPLSPVILGNTIEHNTTGQIGDGGGDGGAGIWVDAASNVAIVSNIIRNNTTLSGNGGGILTFNASPVAIINNLIYDNSAGCGGGAIAFEAGGAGSTYNYLIANNTLVDNTGASVGGYSQCLSISQIYPNPYSYGYSDPNSAIINNIISGSTSYPAVNCSSFSTPSESTQPLFQNNILENAGGSFFGSYCIDVSGEYNNRVTVPQFVNPITGDYHLQGSSPAIDRGLNSVLLSVLTMTGFTVSTDLDGNPRVQDTTSTPCAIIDMGAYEYPGTITNCDTTTETLTSSLNPSTYGAKVTFTATLTSTSGTPTGSVQFKDGTTVLAVQTVSANGTSSYSTATLAVGTHSITAVYEPTGVFSAATASLSQVVNGDATITDLTSSVNPSTYGQAVTFTAYVTSAFGTPTGSIAFADGTTQLITLPLNASGMAQVTTSSLTANNLGTTPSHEITATYMPSGSFNASTGDLEQIVNGLPTTTTVAVTPNPSTYGQPVIFSAHVAPVAPNKAVPTGTVNFLFCRGAEFSATLDASGNVSVIQPFPNNPYEIAEPVSSCTFTAQYFGDTIFAPSTSATGTYIVTPSPSTTTIISASPNPAYFSQTVSFTVQVKGVPSPTANPVTGQPIPPATTLATGTINLYDGTVLIGSGPVVAGAAGNQAVININTLSIGSHTIIASYSGDANLGGSASSPITEVITAAPPPDFSLTGTNITFPFLHSGTGDLELTSLNNFSGSIALTCNPPYPANYTCTLQYPSISLTAGESVVLTFTLTYSATATVHTKTRIVLAAFFPLTLVSLLGLARKRRTILRAILSLALLAILTTTTTACGPDHFIPITTGTYPLTFTATGTSQGTSTPITHTVTINATITP